MQEVHDPKRIFAQKKREKSYKDNIGRIHESEYRLLPNNITSVINLMNFTMII